MKNLVEEHVFGRNITKKISQANTLYRNGDDSVLTELVDNLRVLTDFYPKHIEKEDKIFFPAAVKYLSDKEDQDPLDAYYEFDKKMIHEKYTAVVEDCEKQLSGA